MCMQSSLLFCIFPGTFLTVLYNNERVPRNVQGTGAWDRNLSNSRLRHALVIPRGDISCAICEPPQDSCCCVFLGEFTGPAWHSPLTLPGPPFIPTTIFKMAGIQSKH